LAFLNKKWDKNTICIPAPFFYGVFGPDLPASTGATATKASAAKTTKTTSSAKTAPA
jgi:hypothetical protein